MAIKTIDGSYACGVCGKTYPTPAKADSCRDSHDMLYIPMSTSELNLLLNAIISNNFNLVPASLFETLRKYARHQVTKDTTDA